ncbi:hypothetical protein A2957_02865 [Candidatus Roizmanbacteria bacterium RIFCSPLOWO2_01_FULL_38_11]|uniref:Uncharacterized protein n=1 Tax=Candidatus Roizmanbacteria bacterium RIFCSPLOWO2_01_FULL_38_11 TaxID=1802060 RepID=A0A1F7IJY9_9BACT|nr:MAG: hypothetical protein A2957_02865 [Candidatus Roizmanbacteria bacterium RIFCSPLOWO2_01_FULL_38_11]
MSELNAGDEPSEELPSRAEVKKITLEDLHPVVPEKDGTVIVVMRNAKDDRSDATTDLGALKPEAAEATYRNALAFFEGIVNGVPETERGSLDFLIVASDATLTTPLIQSEHKRAVETADQIMRALNETMTKYSLSKEQLLNKSEKPIELKSGRITDVRMMEESPEFVAWLKARHTAKDGTFTEFGPNGFWAEYEIDGPEIQTKRREMRVEGPKEIAHRVNGYVATHANSMQYYHDTHPGRRVVTFVVGHYDSISPWLKRYVVKEDFPDFTQELPVTQGAGVVLNIKPRSTHASTSIQGNEYDIPLAA